MCAPTVAQLAAVVDRGVATHPKQCSSQAMASLGDTYDALDGLATDYFAAVRDHGRGSGPARDVLAGAHSLLLAHGAVLSTATHGSPGGDAVRGWARKRIRVITSDEYGWTPNAALVADLRAWCTDTGAECPDSPSRAIGRHLGAMGAEGIRGKVQDGPRTRGWRVKLMA